MIGSAWLAGNLPRAGHFLAHLSFFSSLNVFTQVFK
jgi:hypothetical protein